MFSVVDTLPTVRGWKGQDIRLPCHFQGDPAIVAWVKESISQLQQLTKAEFIDGNFESREKGFDIDKNFSLVITDLKVADEGLYVCRVVLKNLENFESYVLLTVNFSERLPTTVQTTVNSEDDSRKWYSVQWTDFKLCCRRLQDVSTQHPRVPFWLYVLYRFAIAAYFFAFWIASVVLAVEALGPKFLLFLPFWTYIPATCHVCLACFNASATTTTYCIFRCILSEKNRYRIQWFLFNLSATPSIIVTGFYWRSLNLAIYVSVHLLPTVVCLIEIFLTLIVVRFVHVVYPFFFMFIYLLFIVIFWAAGGTDSFGNPAVSPLLDFENDPGIAAATVVGVAFATLLAQAILKGLYVLRVRCMDSKRTKPRTEAVPPTEEPVAVELETLTA
ncbi:protein rolling stone-like [Diadema antillarum]|uniref:protein rolling stone-like n=1 Tax=Diadema antillarum TaxID=105358 RepID=UPI003A87989D